MLYKYKYCKKIYDKLKNIEPYKAFWIPGSPPFLAVYLLEIILRQYKHLSGVLFPVL